MKLNSYLGNRQYPIGGGFLEKRCPEGPSQLFHRMFPQAGQIINSVILGGEN